MKTLYDLLGALPDDDAESLRSAFRKAVKGTHPDVRPGDPDAALKFRQIIRANEILMDEEQRAAYDHLLDLARLEQQAASKRRNLTAIYWLATGITALASIFIASLGGYLLLGHLAFAHMADGFRDGASRTAAVIGLLDTFERTKRRDKLDDVNTSKKLDRDPKERNNAMTAGAVGTGIIAGAPSSSDVALVGDVGLNDAEHFRQQGILAYRSGDLYLSLADFNLAIHFDPKFSEAYLDRAIVFHRIGDLQRAFDDIAEAKRIDKSNGNETASIAASAP